MQSTTQYVALSYDELSEIQEDIRDIEPSELARLLRLTRFVCKAERVLHGALIRDFIDLYIEEQSPQVQRHVLQATRQLKAGHRISSPPPLIQTPVNEAVVDDDSSEVMADCIRVRHHYDNDDDHDNDDDVSMTGNKGNPCQTVYYNGHPAAVRCTQRPYVPTPEGGGTPCILSGGSSPFASSAQSDIHHDVLMLEPYRGIAKKARLGSMSLYGDDVDANNVIDNDDFVDIDEVSCASSKKPTSAIESFDAAESSSSRATSVVDLTDDYMSGYPQAAEQTASSIPPDTVDERQAERHAPSLDLAHLPPEINPPNAMPGEETPPWDSPYAGTWGFAADDQINAVESGIIESFSEDGDEDDLDSLPDRPWTPDFGPGKDIDGPQRESSIFVARSSPPQRAATSERPARQITPIITQDAINTPPRTTIVNGIPTPVTGSFASTGSAYQLFDGNESSPTPAARLHEQSRGRSPTTEPLWRFRYQATVETELEFSLPTSPVRFSSRAGSQPSISEARDSPPHAAPASPIRGEESPEPLRRGRQGRTGQEIIDNEAEDIISGSPSAVRPHRSNSSEPPRRHPRRYFPSHRDHRNNDGEDIFEGPPIPFPPLHSEVNNDALNRATAYFWRIAANMSEDMHVVSAFIHKLHGFTNHFMTPLRALCERYSELTTEVSRLKRKREEDEEVIRDLVRGRREDAEKIAGMAEDVRELKKQFRELKDERGAKRFKRRVV